MVKDGKGNGSLPDPPCTDEGDRLKLVGERDDLVDQGVTAEKGLRCRGRRFSEKIAMKILDCSPCCTHFHKPRLSLGRVSNASSKSISDILGIVRCLLIDPDAYA